MLAIVDDGMGQAIAVWLMPDSGAQISVSYARLIKTFFKDKDICQHLYINLGPADKEQQIYAQLSPNGMPDRKLPGAAPPNNSNP